MTWGTITDEGIAEAVVGTELGPPIIEKRLPTEI